jgi:hypothetical protein
MRFLPTPVKPITEFRLLLLHASAVSIPTALCLVDADPWWTLSIGGLLITLTYIYIGYAQSKRQEFWLSPLSFFFYWYSVGYGISAIYAASESYQTGYLPLVTKLVPGDDLARGYVLSLLGALSLHLGYFWVQSLEIRDGEAKSGGAPSDFRFWTVAFLIGLLTLFRPEYFGFIGTARSILQFAPLAILLSLCSVQRQYFRLSGPAYALCVIIGNILLILAYIYDGSKYRIMLSLMPMLSAALVRPRLKKLLPVFVVAGTIVYLFVVAPVITRMRTDQTAVSRLEKLRAAGEDSFLSTQEDLSYSFQEEAEKFLYRQFESTAVGFIVSDVRAQGFQYGATMENLTYAFIPRLLWPEKPMVTRGLWFTAYLGGSGSEEEAESNTALYSAGELYWNFGILGVVLGMAIMGAMFALIAAKIGEGPHLRVVPMIIFANVLANIVEQGAATQVFIFLVYLLILTSAYYYWPSSLSTEARSKSLARITTEASYNR